MAFNLDVTIKEGSDAIPLRGTIKDADGPYNLTGCTVEIVVTKKGGRTAIVTDPCVLENQNTDPGGFYYEWDAALIAVPGIYELEIVVTTPLATVFRVPAHKDYPYGTLTILRKKGV